MYFSFEFYFVKFILKIDVKKTNKLEKRKE